MRTFAWCVLVRVHAFLHVCLLERHLQLLVTHPHGKRTCVHLLGVCWCACMRVNMFACVNGTFNSWSLTLMVSVHACFFLVCVGARACVFFRKLVRVHVPLTRPMCVCLFASTYACIPAHVTVFFCKHLRICTCVCDRVCLQALTHLYLRV